MVIRCTQCAANIPADWDEGKEAIIEQWNTRYIIDDVVDANDDQIYTQQERAELLVKAIDKYNKYED